MDDRVPGARPATDAVAGDPQLRFLRSLVDERAIVAGDVIALRGHTWAIHGSIAVDGEVIMAEFDSEDRARLVLGALGDARDARP